MGSYGFCCHSTETLSICKAFLLVMQCMYLECLLRTVADIARLPFSVAKRLLSIVTPFEVFTESVPGVPWPLETYLLYLIRTHFLNQETICLRTHSMEHSPFWEADRFSAIQEIPRFLWKPKVSTAFTRARHLSLSWARSIQSMTSLLTSCRSILI